MNNISCDTCMNLIPSVKDGAASQYSRMLVEEHIKTCEPCRKILGNQEQFEMQIDDKIIAGKIKNPIKKFLLAAILIGAVFGMLLTNSMNVFYNALIMPLIGGLGFLCLRKKTVWLTVGLFLFTSIWQFFQFYLIDGIPTGSSILDLVTSSLFYSVIYTFFSIIGIVIAMLLEYAFMRDLK